MRSLARLALMSLLWLLMAGSLSAQRVPPADLAVGPFTVAGDSAGVLRAAADTVLQRIVAALSAKGITTTRRAGLSEKTVKSAAPVPWALLGHLQRSKGEVGIELRIMEVATGDEMVSYMNSGKNVQALMIMDRVSPRIVAFIEERRPKSQ